MPVPHGVSKKKYDDCVDQVKAKGNVDNPYAVCATSLKQAFAPKKKEAVSGSSMPQLTRSGVKKDAK